MSENIADVAGLSVAYDAYHSSHVGKSLPKVNGFDDEQRFFIAYAQSWRSKVRPELLRVLLATDGHAPDQSRADTVRNIDAWYKSFNIQPGRKLYLAPDARVRVW